MVSAINMHSNATNIDTFTQRSNIATANAPRKACKRLYVTANDGNGPNVYKRSFLRFSCGSSSKPGAEL